MLVPLPYPDLQFLEPSPVKQPSVLMRKSARPTIGTAVLDGLLLVFRLVMQQQPSMDCFWCFLAAEEALSEVLTLKRQVL